MFFMNRDEVNDPQQSDSSAMQASVDLSLHEQRTVTAVSDYIDGLSEPPSRLSFTTHSSS